ncbi:hypothetical protein [Streptomyces sp. NPDC004296]|uniref:hypothetical protein n=1 Tax=Streptomyces sp. NPDC004296 TaxID=3364697 RepID=UPI0036C17503
MFRLRTGAWPAHRAGDRFLTREAFKRVHSAVFDGARFEEAPNGYVMFWRCPRAEAGPTDPALPMDVR